jgi:hypothetical protein
MLEFFVIFTDIYQTKIPLKLVITVSLQQSSVNLLVCSVFLTADNVKCHQTVFDMLYAITRVDG